VQHTNTPHDVPSVCLGQSCSNRSKTSNGIGRRRGDRQPSTVIFKHTPIDKKNKTPRHTLGGVILEHFQGPSHSIILRYFPSSCMYFCNIQHKKQTANIQTHSRYQCVAVFGSVLQCFSMDCQYQNAHPIYKFEVCLTGSECKCESPRIPASPIRVCSRREKGPVVVGTKCKTDLAGTDVTGHVCAEDQTRLCTHAHNMHATKSLHLNTRLSRYLQSLALRIHSSSRTSRSSRHFVLLAPSES